MKQIKKSISAYNGISMYSNIMPIVATETYYDENNRIKCRKIRKYSNAVNEYIRYKEKLCNVIACIVDLILMIICIVTVLIHQYAFTALILVALASNVIVEYSEVFAFAIMKCFKNSKTQSIARFHAAEHMIINSYEQTQEILTCEEIKKYSRFSKNCGSMEIINSIFNKTFLCFIVFFTTKLISYFNNYVCEYESIQTSNIAIKIIVILCFMIFVITFQAFIYIKVKKFVIKTSILKFMQCIYTQKPTEYEIILAIEAVKNFEKMERKFEKQIAF